MPKDIVRSNEEFNEFVYGEFTRLFPRIQIKEIGLIAEFLGIGKTGAKSFAEKWRQLASRGRRGGDNAEKRGRDWKIKQDRIELIHDTLSMSRRKALQNKISDSRRQGEEGTSNIRISRSCREKLKEAVDKYGGGLTVGGIVERLVDRHLTEAINEEIAKDRPRVSLPGMPGLAPEKSIGDTFIVCLECGWQGVYLRRHLKDHEIAPEEYIKKWGLPAGIKLTPRKFKT
ncbi:MAG: MucR family transcriptional regulator [Rhodospirillales bacterium]|nr:MucR family transcriptional regulator [Rhodospirillales bacterium]